MTEVTLKSLLEAGAHFGHQTKRWNPKMARFILTARNGIHLINLKKTLSCLNEAMKAAKDTIESGKSVLFVGTKKQAADTVREEAERCEAEYVSYRWLGGM
ncbi:MAG: 30S ribosomal protein S2, partial [Fibrobacterota bacterium]